MFKKIVEKSSKYYLVKNILLALFEIIDSEQVPQNPKRRVPYLTGSGGIQLNDSINSHAAPGDFSTASSTSSVVPSPTTVKDAAINTMTMGITRRLTNYSSVSRSSIGDTGDPISEGSNELADLITRCLRICGEEDGFLPLFKVVFNNLSEIEDNRYTHRLDGRGRDILLTGLITRMIRYVTEHVGLVFFSDDVQCKLHVYFYMFILFTVPFDFLCQGRILPRFDYCNIFMNTVNVPC